MYGLFGKLTAQPGQRDALIDQLLQAANLMPEIEGCHLYIINAAPDDPNAIWVYEAWRSQADHDASLNHEMVKAVIAAARPLIAGGGERFVLTPVGGKGLKVD